MLFDHFGIAQVVKDGNSGVASRPRPDDSGRGFRTADSHLAFTSAVRVLTSADRARITVRRMDLCLGHEMSHRIQQAGIDSCEPRQGPGIELIVFSATVADQSHIARVSHDHLVPQLGQLPPDPR